MQASFEVQLPTLALEAPHTTLGQRFYGHHLVGTNFTVYTPDSLSALASGRYRVTPIRAHARRGHGLVVAETVASAVTARFEVADAAGYELPPGRVMLWGVAVEDARSTLPAMLLVSIHDNAPPSRVVVRPVRAVPHALERLAQRLRITPADARTVMDNLLLSAGLAPSDVVARYDVKPPAAALWIADYFGKRVVFYATADGVVLTVLVEPDTGAWSGK